MLTVLYKRSLLLYARSIGLAEFTALLHRPKFNIRDQTKNRTNCKVYIVNFLINTIFGFLVNKSINSVTV